MSRSNRIIIAATLAVLLIITATSAWAAPLFQDNGGLTGSVPPIPLEVIPVTGDQNCPNGFVAYTRTAIFTGCIRLVEWVDDPVKTYIGAPEAMAFYGDTFTVTAEALYPIIEACYAYPPGYAEKNVQIYRLKTEFTPFEWIAVPDPDTTIRPGMICVTSPSGIFTLLGNK